MDKNEPWQGKMYMVAHIECATKGCQFFAEYGGYLIPTMNRTWAARQAQKDGWFLKPRVGWLCPECAKNR